MSLESNIYEIVCSNFELVTNDVSKAFEEVNAATDLPGFDTIAGIIYAPIFMKGLWDLNF